MTRFLIYCIGLDVFRLLFLSFPLHDYFHRTLFIDFNKRFFFRLCKHVTTFARSKKVVAIPSWRLSHEISAEKQSNINFHIKAIK